MAVSYVLLTGTSGTGALTSNIPAGYGAGDLLVLVLSGRDSLPALPDGWTNINTVNNGTDIYNRTCYKIASASESAVSIADSGAFTAARMFLFKGNATTNPINVSGTNTSSGTSFSATGVTTTVDGCMVVHATAFQDAGTANDTANYGTPSNANLSSLTERSDVQYYGGSAGLFGGIYLVTGIKETAGATGNTTATADSANNKSATVTFAISPPIEAAVPEGGSDSTVIVSVQGSGTSIYQGSSNVTVVVSSQGSGIAIRQGAGSSTVIVAGQGAGNKTGNGSSDATVLISTDGAGTKTVQDGSSSGITVSVQASGYKQAQGGSELSITVSVDGAGEVIKTIESGSESTVIVTAQGSGIKVVSSGAESAVTVSADADGIKLGQSGAEPSVIISTQGGGYSIGLIKSGGSETIVVVSADGLGSKISSGSSDIIIIIDAEGFGTDYSPIVMTAIFASGASVTALFSPSSALAAVFHPTAEQTATFNTQAELTAAFIPAVEIGGQYGNS